MRMLRAFIYDRVAACMRYAHTRRVRMAEARCCVLFYADVTRCYAIARQRCHVYDADIAARCCRAARRFMLRQMVPFEPARC